LCFRQPGTDDLQAFGAASGEDPAHRRLQRILFDMVSPRENQNVVDAPPPDNILTPGQVFGDLVRHDWPILPPSPRAGGPSCHAASPSR
jgi:hypothetical protein